MDNSIPNISAEDIARTKSTAWLSYLGFLFIVPMLVNKDSAYSKFHVNQGIVLFIFDIALGLVGGILGGILAIIPGLGALLSGLILFVIYIVLFVFWILGIVNAATGKVKRLPIIGGINIYK